MELIKLELTSGEMHNILKGIYFEKEHCKQELREFGKCNQEISDIQTIDAIKCHIDDLEQLGKKLFKARAEWLVKPIHDADVVNSK